MSTQDHPDTVVTAPNVKERKYLKSLKCPLTQKELNQASDDLVEALTAIDSINAELEEIKADYKHKLKSAEAEVGKQRTLLRNGFEMREVDCLEVRNFSDRKLFTVRIDTNEIIEERGLTANELQMPLPMSDVDGEPETTEATDDDSDGAEGEEE